MLHKIEQPEDALRVEDLRELCYQLAADAHLAALSLQQEEDFDNNETLLAINFLLYRWKDRLNEVAGGSTFDRLGRLESKAEPA